MATIQIHDIPEDAHDTLRRRARGEGRSIQWYMREQVLSLATRPTEAELVQRIEDGLAERGWAGRPRPGARRRRRCRPSVSGSALVPDASALVHAVTHPSAGAARLRERLAASTVHAPHLLDAETGSVLRRRVMSGALMATPGRCARTSPPTTPCTQRWPRAWTCRWSPGTDG